jgi:hypothetical protein
MAGKRRKPGQWVQIANGRNRPVAPLNRAWTTGINYPNLGDVGSAAYRREMAKRDRRGVR